MTVIEDIRYAVRALRAHAPFAATIAAILAIAIGANTAVFALVYATLLNPLPFPDQDRLVTVDQTRADSPREPLSLPDFRDLRDGNTTFEALAAAFSWSANLTGGEPERVQVMRTTASFFTVTRARAAAGRLLGPEDERGSGARVAVLTHRFWLRRFGGEPALGSALILNGDSYAIVGVLPAAFITPIRDAEVILPFPIDTDPRRAARASGFLRAIGRLRPGVSIEQARADLDAIMARLRTAYPDTNATHLGTQIVEWRRQLVANQRSALLLLQGAVALVLLVACANVANLFLAAALRREHEFAVRAALGASRARRMRQVFIETLIIAMAAAAGGLAIQSALAGTLAVLAPRDFLALAPADALSPRLLAFTAGITLAATLLFGLFPALRLGSSTSLRAARGASAATRRMRSLLVAAEIAIASMLIITAVVLSRSVANLQSVDPGFRADHLLTARLALPRSRYPRTEPIARFVEALRPRLLEIPGVVDAAAANVVPLNGWRATSDVWPEDRPVPPPGERAQAQYRMISPTYIGTFGVPLIAGRSFDDHDHASAERVVLISRTLARRFWDVPAAIGQTLVIDDSPSGPRKARIVGVVGDVKHYGLDTEVTPDVYTPIPQVSDFTSQWLANNLYWGIRTAGDPLAAREAFRRALKAVDADIPAASIQSMETAIDTTLAPKQMNLWLVRAFAGVALLLAAAGVYAVTAFTVALRRREMAIRSALGARFAQNLRAVVVDAGTPIAVGVVIGAAGALLAAPALRAVVFDVEPTAPGPFVVVSAVLLAAGLVSALTAALPLRRVHPIEALRTD